MVRPALSTRVVVSPSVVHSPNAFVTSVSMRARDSAVAHRAQSSDGRHVGSAGDSKTLLPFACGNHFTNSALSLNSGRMITCAVTGTPLVPGLQASIVPSSERTRGLTRSMCETPRRHPRQVPYRSALASMPHDLYWLITQSLAAL